MVELAVDAYKFATGDLSTRLRAEGDALLRVGIIPGLGKGAQLVEKLTQRAVSELGVAHVDRLFKAGHVFVCDKCNSKLIIALTLEEATKQKAMPGIYCPKDGKHFFMHIHLQEDRDNINALFEKMRKVRDENKDK